MSARMPLSEEFFPQLASTIAGVCGDKVAEISLSSIHGGDINGSYRLSFGDRNYFLKTNRADCLPMFEAEMAALNAIARTKAFRTPMPICTGVLEDFSYLVLEWIDLYPVDSASAGRLGK